MRIAKDVPATTQPTKARVGQDVAPVVAPEPQTVEAPLRSAATPEMRDANALQDLLARKQLRLVDAQTYLSRSLATAPLVSTQQGVERAASEALVGLADGRAVDAGALVAGVHAQGGDAAVALLPDALRAHAKAIAADQPGFEATDVIAQVEAAIFTVLAKTDATPDRRRALASMIAASNTLDGARAPETWMYDALHNYTNERGLPATLAKVAKDDGAAIGVSGALFDVAAARGAGLVVLTDVMPPLKDWFLLTAAVLLVVDELADKNGWDPARRAAEVRRRLTDPPYPQQRAGEPSAYQQHGEHVRAHQKAVVAELAAFGVDNDSLVRMKLALAQGARAQPPAGCWLDNPEAVQHLTRLALEGRIVATTTDLADPALAGRLQALLAAHGKQVGTLHLSNALDYTPGTAPIVETMAALPRTPGSIFIACTDGGYGFEFLGGFADPKAQPFDAFLGADGVGAQIDRIRFARGDGVRLWNSLVRELGGKPSGEAPRTFAEYVKRKQELFVELLGSPEDLAKALDARLLRNVRFAENIVSREALEAARPPLPTSIEELEQSPARFDAKLWTLERRRDLIAHFAQRFRVRPETVAHELGEDALRVPIAQLARHAENAARMLPSDPDLEAAFLARSRRG
jgi:hypothetical protein